VLHNQSALRLKARLLFTPGVVVVNVPYQLWVSDQGWLGDWPTTEPGAAGAAPGTQSGARSAAQSGVQSAAGAESGAAPVGAPGRSGS
jgi:hypothetical protein